MNAPEQPHQSDEQFDLITHESLTPDILLQILDGLDEIIYIADCSTHEILFANARLKKLFGFNPIGKKCWQFIHASSGPCRFCNAADLLDAGPGAVSYWQYQNPFNKRWYSARDEAIRWPDGRLVRLEIAKDITEHRQLQTFLDEAHKQAETARNFGNRYVALVAHDLKSPFVSILGMLRRILRKETFASVIHRQFLENIINNGQRMLNMIDSLLAADRLGNGRIKLDLSFFDVALMVDEVLANFAILADEKQLHLDNQVPTGLEIYADRYLYFVVLNNLLSNATKFSFAGGTIVVSASETDGQLCLKVSDSGQGMPEAVLATLFQADRTLSRTGTKGEKGSGLGLVFCRQIIQAHGGTITVNSSEGEGTTFCVALGSCCRLPEQYEGSENQLRGG